MTLEELSILYTADVAPAMQSIAALLQYMQQTSTVADGLADDFAAAGMHAGDGLAGGILSRQGAVMAAARQVADAAAEALRSALSIHSPSRVTQDVGAQFDEGLAQGILGGAGLVDAAVGQLSPAMSVADNAAAQPVTSALQDVHITIPIEVDGYQLGVAAIEGINRVSRVSGRAEISI